MKQRRWGQIALWAFSLTLFVYVWSLIPWADIQAVVEILSFWNLLTLLMLNIIIVLNPSL